MRKTVTVFLWEFKKLLTNWRKALTVFLIPAVLMMVALNLFPLLINYMTTGTVIRKPIMAIDAPESFKEFTESDLYTLPYGFIFIDSQDTTDKELKKELQRGRLIIKFTYKDFDKNIRDFYDEVYNGNTTPESKSRIELYFDGNSMTMYGRSLQFEEEVLPNYETFCFEKLAGDYKDIGWNRFKIDDFNPMTTIVKNRGTANNSASRLIPGIILLLLYYCVYSLSCDLFAAERDRGFLRKLIMTPVSPASIFGGKTAAVIIISFISALVTYLVLLFASWVNITNDSMSLLPFGMLLTGKEMFAFLLLIPPTAFIMTAICLRIIFSLEKMNEILMNLQFPLILFLLEFFAQMARTGKPFLVEYLVPIHGTICGLRDIFATDIRWSYLLLTIFLDILVGSLIFRSTFKKIGDGSYDG